MSEIYDDQCTLELMGEGKAVLTLDGEVMDCTWTLDGETFVLNYYTVASPGTMKDGQITIDYMEMGMIMTFAKTGEATPSTEDVVETTPEETANASASGFGGANTYQVEEWASHAVTTVNFTLPENMWVVNPQVNTLYVYNVESLDVAHSASPRIQFEVKENMEMVDSYVKDMTELVELDTRTIGGIDMKGRSYKLWGMGWTEYYGELPNGFWMTVRISKTSVDAGSEGSAILDSVTFE
jgi:hypothetical protein